MGVVAEEMSLRAWLPYDLGGDSALIVLDLPGEKPRIPLFHLRKGQCIIEGGDGEVSTVDYGDVLLEGVDLLSVVIVTANQCAKVSVRVTIRGEEVPKGTFLCEPSSSSGTVS